MKSPKSLNAVIPDLIRDPDVLGFTQMSADGYRLRLALMLHYVSLRVTCVSGFRRNHDFRASLTFHGFINRQYPMPYRLYRASASLSKSHHVCAGLWPRLIEMTERGVFAIVGYGYAATLTRPSIFNLQSSIFNPPRRWAF